MKKPILAAALTMLLLMLGSSFSSAFVFRDVEAEREAEWQRYLDYKEGYIDFYDLKGYEGYVSEYNMQARFGFYHPSRYTPPYYAWQAKYNPPLQGEVYSTYNRHYASSLDQPSAVQKNAEIVNGRYVGFVPPELNGVYFDHPSARTTYGYLSTGGWNSGSWSACEGCGYYARVADQVTDDFYVVRFY